MAAIVGREDVVSCLCERNNDMAELIRCFREAVNEEDRTLGLARQGAAFCVKDPDFRVGLLDPGLTVLRFGKGFGCHDRAVSWSLNC